MKRQIISRKTASNRLSVSLKTLDRWIRQGRIQAFKAKNSSRVLIYEDTLTQEYLQSPKPKFKNQI